MSIPARRSSPTQTRMWFTGWVIYHSKRSLSSSRFRTLATASGRFRYTTLTQTRSASLVGSTELNRASTWLWGRTGKVITPTGIAGVVRSTTNFAVTMPRIFMDDTPEDHAAIQPALTQIQFYPLSQFDGKMKTKDWSKIPKMEKPGVPAKYSTTQPPWVDPATLRPATGRHAAGAADARRRGAL